MKSIKSFKYKNTLGFETFLKDLGYEISDVEGFSLIAAKPYYGNTMKVYEIHFNDGQYFYYKKVIFKGE